jgi:hypothetical protein
MKHKRKPNRIDDVEMESAIVYAASIIGYPCPCENCSNDGGLSQSNAIMELAFDFMGITPIQLPIG